MRQNIKTRSGNRLAIVIDGKQIGLMQSLRANDDFGLEAASGIGDAEAQEHVPGMARHSLSVSFMVLKRGAMFEAGIATENAEHALRGLVFDVEVYDKDEGTLLRKYIGCSYSSGDLEVSKHAIVMQSAQLLALSVTGLGA